MGTCFCTEEETKRYAFLTKQLVQHWASLPRSAISSVRVELSGVPLLTGDKFCAFTPVAIRHQCTSEKKSLRTRVINTYCSWCWTLKSSFPISGFRFPFQFEISLSDHWVFAALHIGICVSASYRTPRTKASPTHLDPKHASIHTPPMTNSVIC